MRGRPEDLTPSYVQRPLESLLPDLDALDFDGIYIDRRGFVDRGREVEARLEELTGTKALVSEDQTKSFFDLRPYRRTLPPPSESMREAARHPLQLDWNGGFGSLHDSGRFYPQLSSTTSVRSGSQGATLRVENTRSATRRLSLHANAQLTGGGEGTLEVRAPGTELDFAVGPGPTPIVIEVEIPPGSTTISFRTKPTGPATANGDEQPPTFSLREVWFDGPFVSV